MLDANPTTTDGTDRAARREPEPAVLLQLVGVSKRYGDRLALDSLSLDVHAGEVVCLLGGNGAGKTTAIHALLGFVVPSAGKARVAGVDAAEDPKAARAAAAYVPEVVVLYEHLNALENLEFLCALAGRRLTAAELEHYLVEAGLERDALRRKVATYSKGMRQKVGLALALAREAKALLLDEPLSGLDPKAAYEFTQLVQQRASSGAAVLVATHDLHRAKDMATRIGILKAGRLADLISASRLSHADLERVYLEHMRK